MSKITLNKINNLILKCDERYGEVYPKFKELELKYIQQFDKLLMEAQSIFTNQPSREAYARQEIQKMPEFEEFYTLQVEETILRVRMRNLGQISRNIVSSNYLGGGEDHE